jgi:hypothetical protein
LLSSHKIFDIPMQKVAGALMTYSNSNSNKNQKGTGKDRASLSMAIVPRSL